MKGDLLLPARRIDVEVADVEERGALFGPHPGDDGDLVVSAAQDGEVRAVHRDGRSAGHVEVAHAGDVRAVGIGLQVHGKARRPPVVAHARGGRNGPENLGDARREGAKRRDVLAGNADLHGDAEGRPRLELPHVHAGAGNLGVERPLQRLDQMIGVVRVGDLDEHLGIVQLSLLRRGRVPEPRRPAADEGRQRAKHLAGLALHGMLFPVLGDHPPDFVQAQRLDAAETLLREAQETSRLTSQRVYDAELHRVWGELHSTRGDAAAAERDLLQAISLADQGAFWHRFRAAAALARLLVEHGRASDASHVLHPALAAISADESCPEVASARALLAPSVS